MTLDEHQFAVAFEKAPMGMALVSPDTRVLRANRALCTLLGCTEPQLQALRCQDIVHPDDAAADLAARIGLLAGDKESYQAERRYLRTDGRVIWGHLACSLVRDAGGTPLHFIVQLQDISERKRVEQALRQSEKRFRSLMMLSSDWYWEQDENFRYVSSIGGPRGAWGPDSFRGGPDQVAASLGKCRWEFDGATPLGTSWAQHRAVLEAHQPFRDFEYLRLADGQPARYISASGEPVFDAGGRFTGYRGTARDITGKKLAEKRLRDMQSLLHMAAQIGRLGAWAYDVAEDEVTWSEEVCAIHEVPQGYRLNATHSLDFYTPRYRGAMFRLLRTCLDEGTPFDVETQIITAKGRMLWVRIICEAEWDAQGKVRRLLGACQDISETKRVAQDAYAMAKQLTATLESLTDAFFTVDREWRFTYMNAQAERLLRRPREELLGKKMTQGFGDLSVSQFPKHFQRALEDNVSLQFEEYYPPFDLWAQAKVYPSKQGLAVYIKDVTERTKAQTEIMRLNAELEERVRERTSQLQLANRELEAFSYSIAHDLRAPLSSIDGFSRALEQAEGGNLAPQSQHYLRRVRAGVKQMAELTDGMLALSSLSQSELIRQEVDLAGMASAILGSLREQLPPRAVDIAIESPLPAFGDPRLLHQVLANLVGNAWKFTSRKEQARIEVGRVQGEQGPAYFVRDNGAGFDPAYASRLFQAFHRMHSSTEFEGSGIGLAIVEKIVMRHGGQVWAESVPEQGATFFFTLGPGGPETTPH